MSRETLCWSCKNYNGKCSWSKCFKPVDGWTATKTFLITENEESYVVHKCPLFKLDKLILTNEQVAKLLKISSRQFYRLGEQKILKRLLDLNYDVVLTCDNRFILRSLKKLNRGKQ